MSSFVIDSSVVLAFLNQEKGADRCEEFLFSGMMSTVNVAEVLTKAIESGHTAITARKSFDLLDLQLIDFDIEQATKAAELRSSTKHAGLSLGDRSCLALAVLKGATAVTADRSWKSVKVCPLEFIR